MKVRFLESYYASNLQTDVNNWLASNPDIKVIDIQPAGYKDKIAVMIRYEVPKYKYAERP